MQVDINCDTGESFVANEIGNEKEMMSFITSANIGCGYHGGDPMVMDRTVRMAMERALRMVREGTVVARIDETVQLRADTLCIHGDNPGAHEMAAAMVVALKTAGIQVRPMAEFL